MRLSGKKLKRAVRLFSLISIILASAWPAFAGAIRLELVDFWYTEEVFVMRDGAAEGGAMAVSDPVSGVSLNIQSVVHAYADVSKFFFEDWDEDAQGHETITWRMELALVGDPGAAVEILGEWNQWMVYLVGCEPDGLTPSGTNATIETGATILVEQKVCMLGMCSDVELPLDEATAHVGDAVLWLGVVGGEQEVSGHFSLGTYSVGQHFQVAGIFSSLAWADVSPFGRADSYGWSNYDLRLYPEATQGPTEIPEPASFILIGAGLGVVALATRHRGMAGGSAVQPVRHL